MKTYLFNFFKGVLYGVFSISPGLSGGVLATYLGDYDKLILIYDEKKITKDNLLFILFILFGFIIGIVISSKVVLDMYNKYYSIFKSIIFFISIWILHNMIKLYSLKKQGLIITSSVILYIFIKNFNIPIFYNNTRLKYVFGAVIYSFGKIIPGISSTTLLINFGMYERVLLFFSDPICEFVHNITSWFLFWSFFSITSLSLLTLITKYKDTVDVKIIVSSIMIVNILLLI